MKVIIKDKEKASNILNVWSGFIPNVSVGRIYRLTNLRVDRYPPDLKPHHLSTTMATKIHDITNDTKDEFEGITLADGSQSGTVLTIHQVYVYDACTKCLCKVEFSTIICGVCKSPVHERKKTFRYELCLDLGDDKTFIITGFMNSIIQIVPMPTPLPFEEEIEDLLNNALEKKYVDVEYTIKPKNNDKIIHNIVLKE